MTRHFAIYVQRDGGEWEPLVFYAESDPTKTLIGLYDTPEAAKDDLSKLRIPANIRVEVREWLGGTVYTETRP